MILKSDHFELVASVIPPTISAEFRVRVIFIVLEKLTTESEI